ncbi:MAG: hypothetical protein IJ308_05255 [Clostridia bacterium]|nr:hypothetical protein [Clostridia bacterium]
MKNFPKKLIAGAVLLATALSSVGCGGTNSDSKQATLYVYSFTSGFQSEWLEKLIADYEALHADVEVPGYPEKGIKIKPTPLGSDVTGAQMRGRQETIYFLEQQDYYDLVANNYVEDITTAITSANPYDEGGKTLESKMFPAQKAYLGREIDGEMHYYAYPHYFTGFGIVYDVELFDTKGYYFVKDYDANGELNNMFFGQKGAQYGWEKTVGPDGKTGVIDGVDYSSDDGLPTTYEEFFLLCDYIAGTGGDRPLTWSGQHRNSYLAHFINALATDYEGAEQMSLNFSFQGEATNLGVATDDGFVFDEEDTPLHGANGYEVARQAGKYYAMDFYQTLYNKSYINKEETKKKEGEFNTSTTLFSSTYSHTAAQNNFLKLGTFRNAMLLDGSWWQAEATSTFTQMGKLNESYSKQNRKLGWMPLPKQSSEKVGEKQTMYDIMYPLLMMKSGVDKDSWQYKYALDFIQFANSDEQLAQFTQITSCTKALNYTLTDTQYDALSYFGKSFYDAYTAADKVFPYDNNLIFANNQNTFRELWDGECSPLYKSSAYAGTFTMALEANVSLKDYFNGMYTNFSGLSGTWKEFLKQ